jgi:hypothetical protein
MDIFRSSLSILLLLTVGAAQDSVKAWPQVHSGTSSSYRTTTHDTLVFSIGSRKIKTVTELHTEEDRSVTQVHPNGSFDLEIKCTRVWGTITGSQYKSPVTFDSAKSKRVHPAAKTYVKMLGRSSVVTVDRGYKVLSVCPRDDDGELGEPDSHAQDLRQLEFIRQAKLPVSVGARWRAPVGIHECTQAGCIELPTHNTLTAMDANSLTIATTAVADHAKDTKPVHRVDRTLKLSRQDGMTLAMQVTGVTRSPGTERDLRFKMERIPTKAAKAPPNRKR